MSLSCDVIIPSYGRAPMLLEALATVFAQIADWRGEIFLVDDASPEPLEPLVRPALSESENARLRVIRHETNRRLGGARNTGIKNSTSEWLAFLDSDDLWLPGHLRALAEARADEAKIVYSSVRLFDSKTNKDLSVFGPLEIDLLRFPESLYPKSYITPSAVMIHRGVFERLGGFEQDPNFHMVEDHDFWLRAAGAGVRFAWSGATSVRYRKHPDAATRKQRLEMAFADLKVLERHRNLPGLSGAIRRKARARIHYFICRHLLQRARNPLRAAYHYLLAQAIFPGYRGRMLPHTLS